MKIIGIKTGTAPAGFMEDPFGYFESEGKNIKPGEKQTDKKGKIKDDPTAVKIIPWNDGVKVVAKRINPAKGKVGESGDPFYEARIMEAVTAAGLPAAKVIARVEQDGQYLLVMEKIGFMSYWDLKHPESLGYSGKEIRRMLWQAQALMTQLSLKFRKAGFIRNWKLNDMVFIIEKKVVTEVFPTDWERTKYKVFEKDIYGHRFNSWNLEEK